MSRTGENIYRRKDGRWEGRYIKARTASGKAIYGYVYSKSYREVKQRLAQASILVNEEKEASSFNKQCNTAVSFCSVAEEWMDIVRTQVKESTFRRYHNLLRTYIFPEFNGILSEQITDSYLEHFCRMLLQSGGRKRNGLSPKTVLDILSVIKMILQFANDQGYPVVSGGKTVFVKQYKKQMRILSVQEQQVLCHYLQTDFNPWNRGILLCLFTGIRIGEICALKWEDISFLEKTVYIHKTMQRIQNDIGVNPKTKVVVTTPKSECSIRHIPLPDELLCLLSGCCFNPQGYFLTDSEYKYMEPRTMQNHFKAALKKTSLEIMNFHSLRHTFATRCIENGFDVKSLSEILGHANVNITMNRYVHPSMELKRENMQKLSSLFSVE